MTIDEIVEALIKEHEGGKEFFNALDEAVRKRDYIDQLYHMFKRDCEERDEEPLRYSFVVSGKFGIYFNKEYPGLNSLIVNGDLKDNNVLDLSPFADQINGREFIFFDDSFYSGTTAKKIALALIAFGGRIEHIYVVYNGSKNPNIHSLYSYYGV